MTHVNPNLEQTHFRGRDDDVALNSATFTQALDTNWTQAVDVPFRARFEVEEDAGGSVNMTGVLEASLNGGAFFTVTTTSTIVKAVPSAQFANDDPTTDVLAGSALDFVAGAGVEDGTAPNVTLLSQHTEHEYCVEIVSAAVLDADTIELRVQGLNVYTQTPTITVSEAAAGITGDLSQAVAIALSAVAAVLVQGTLSAALALGLTASGTVGSAPITGDLNQPVAIGLTAEGSVAVQGTLAQAVPLSLSADGAVVVSGTLSQAVALGLSASGAVVVEAALDRSIPLALTAGGDVLVVGTLSQDVGIALSATGNSQEPAIVGNLNQAVALSLVADGVVLVAGSLAESVALSLSAVGGVVAAGALTRPVALTLSAGGGVLISGTLQQAVALSLSASGAEPVVLRALQRIERTWPIKIMVKRTWKIGD